MLYREQLCNSLWQKNGKNSISPYESAVFPLYLDEMNKSDSSQKGKNTFWSFSSGIVIVSLIFFDETICQREVVEA